jgi:glycosyltransferase involved in cell wall biosynthesis
VDTERYRPAPEPPHGPFRVLYMGQVSLGKGIPYLLRAWKRLGWKDAELWLVGNVFPDLRQAVGPLLDLPGVYTPGYVRDPVAIYQSADVFCIPTLAEGSAKVTFEAMACGLPMITTVEAGSVARHEREALICPAADAQALADALQRLRDDVALRETLGHAARLRIENYTWARYGQRLVEIYRQLLPDSLG